MKVLGINFSNDAAAALVVDGHVVGAVAEERLSRVKHDGGFPARAVRWCLEAGGLSLRDVDAVGFFWNPGIHAEPANSRLTAVPRDHLEYLYAVPVHLMRHVDGPGHPEGSGSAPGVERIEQTLHLDDGHALRIHFLTHHDCHAAAAFFRSNFPSAAVLTVDGYGERASTHLARAEGQRIETLGTVDFPHSLGAFYAAFTQYLGFRPNNGEGKVMGLASYGRPDRFYEPIRRLIRLTDEGFELDLSYFAFYLNRRRRYQAELEQLLGPERAPGEPVEERHMDVAAALQAVVEEALLHLARLARERTGERRLCMAGGVALNCVANARIRFEAGFDELYVMPASSDSGTSLGAALHVAHRLGDDEPVVHPDTDYLGPTFDEERIERALRTAGCRYDRPDDLVGAVADRLARGEIVGWFQGAAELGPRALGARSILADPRPAEMKDRLNERVKFREWFRPFAPSVLEDQVDELFEAGERAPYMLKVYRPREGWREKLGAVTHVDGGARVQTVRRDQHPLYYELICAFDERVSVPAVLNTSFNIRGEPIVHSPEDALTCYATTGLDALAIGPFLLAKQ